MELPSATARRHSLEQDVAKEAVAEVQKVLLVLGHLRQQPLVDERIHDLIEIGARERRLVRDHVYERFVWESASQNGRSLEHSHQRLARGMVALELYQANVERILSVQTQLEFLDTYIGPSSPGGLSVKPPEVPPAQP